LVKKIEAALEHPTEVSFTDKPIGGSAQLSGNLHHIEIWLDKQALQNEVSRLINSHVVITGSH